MNEKSASVHWEGQGKDGRGQISTETGTLKAYPYGFASRFEDDRRGTNPEEILGAAHAACLLKAVVPGIDEAQFQEIAQAAKRDCPLSNALACVAEISLQASLSKGAP